PSAANWCIGRNAPCTTPLPTPVRSTPAPPPTAPRSSRSTSMQGVPACACGCPPTGWRLWRTTCGTRPATGRTSPIDPLPPAARDARRPIADNGGMTDPNESGKDTAPPAKAPVSRLRTLWPFVRKHRALFAGWLFALAASSAATLSLPVAFKTMIDQGFAEGGGGAIDRAFMLLFAVAVALAIATAARFFFVSLLG